jgi:hypothetical protein
VLCSLNVFTDRSAVDELMSDNVSIEVIEIPPADNEETLPIVFENRRITGVNEVFESSLVTTAELLYTFSDAKGV